MNIKSPQTKLLFFLFLFAVVLGLSVMVVSSLKNKGNTIITPTPSLFPSPTLIETIPSGVIIATPEVNPTFTGLKEEPIPTPTYIATAQRIQLIAKSPITTPSFSIFYSYKTDQFTVQIKEPKEQNKTYFESWIKLNYPSLQKEPFRFL